VWSLRPRLKFGEVIVQHVRKRVSRRRFLKAAALATGALAAPANGAETVQLPFENGERLLVEYPQKRPLLRLTARPPQLETPFAVFDQGAITPNDAFFVRYHLTLSPPPAEQLTPDKFRVAVRGSVNTPLDLSIEDLQKFEPVEVVAVNQCSGNSRGFAQPRVPGGQSGHGMMGNARWKGVPLKAVLARAGLQRKAREVVFNGADAPVLEQTPDYVKSLALDHANDGEVLLAWEMNGEALPWLNGYPLRLIVPGYYGTYWVKHVNDINVADEPFNGYWMNPAYRLPDNECHCVPPGTRPEKTIPILRYNVRSFITNLAEGDQIKAGAPAQARGIAFDGGHGIRTVLFSCDDGKSWSEAELGQDLGRYSFRTWQTRFTPAKAGPAILKVRAINRIGQSQPDQTLWNPAGYMRNVVETVKVSVV
jgi:sulfite dehydrogenase (cytochrome) subunit A